MLKKTKFVIIPKQYFLIKLNILYIVILFTYFFKYTVPVFGIWIFVLENKI